MKLVTFMNLRYFDILSQMDQNDFKYYDDYILFLYEVIADGDVDMYYQLLEEDIGLYSDFQTGKEREMIGKAWKIKKNDVNKAEKI